MTIETLLELIACVEGETILRFTGLWRRPDFLKLWAAGTVSNFGSLISRAAMSFTAILVLKATPAQLSLLLASDLAPRFLAGPIAGVWADRVRRRPLMIGADLGRAVLLASIPAAALFHLLRIEQLYLVTVLTGLFTVIFDVADRSYLPLLIRREELVEGNSKLTASASVAEVGAFSLAGWLVQWLGGPFAVLIDALSFLFSALCLGAIVKPEPPPIPHEQREGLGRELAQGIRALRSSPILLVLTGCALILGVAYGIIGTVIVAFMVRDLGFKPGVLGMIWAIGGVASMLGAMAAGPTARRLGVGPAMAIGLLGSALGVLVVPLAHGATRFAMAALIANQVVTDPAHTLYEINQVSLRQTLVADELQGRINGVMEFAGLGATLLGALIGGLLGGWIGLRAALFAGGCISLLAALVLWLSPAGRIREAV